MARTFPSLQTTVFANATLGGTGTISGPVTVSSGGILSPGGTGVGALTIKGGLTNNSPILNFTLSSSPSGVNDLISMNGTLAMNGAQTFNFTLTSNALGAGTYNLIQGATNSTASSVTLVNNLPGNTRQTLGLARPSAGSNPSYIQLNGQRRARILGLVRCEWQHLGPRDHRQLAEWRQPGRLLQLGCRDLR